VYCVQIGHYATCVAAENLIL